MVVYMHQDITVEYNLIELIYLILGQTLKRIMHLGNNSYGFLFILVKAFLILMILTIYEYGLILRNLKLGFVQLLQYYYQKGCLYRLRALGEKAEMDTTVGNNVFPYFF